LLQFVWKKIRSKAAVFTLLVILFFVLAVVLFTDNEISARLTVILSGNDASAWARIFAAVLLLPEIFTQSLTGFPKSVFVNLGYIPSIGVNADELGHNALLNFLIGYGVIGLLALFALFHCARGANKKLFLFLIASQNGALLAPDKFAILSFGFMVYNSLTLSSVEKDSNLGYDARLIAAAAGGNTVSISPVGR
jgi:hypothetical protein